MKNEELQDLYPFENYATLDDPKNPRRMKWCNNTMLYATEYYRRTIGEEITYDGLIKAVRNMKMAAIIALIYGGVRAADPDIDYTRFANIYKSNDHLMDNVSAVLEGITAYLPEPDGVIDDGRDLDESYPDTQAEVKKKESKTKPTGGAGIGSRLQNAVSRLLGSVKPP
jgi:hypothetical protein